MQTTLVLNRLFETEKTTVGSLYVNNEFFCYTIELKWRDNKRSESCIPKGVYEVVSRTTEARGRHLALKNVPGRSSILIHSGNTHLDSLGCILPNFQVNLSSGEPKGASSKKAVFDLNTIVFQLLDKKEVVCITIM